MSKNPLVILAALVAFGLFNPLADAQGQKPTPTQQQQQQQQQQTPKRMEIPADAAFYQDVSWSPDGKSLAYTKLTGDGQGGRCDIYVMRADGSRPTRVTNEEGAMHLYTSWSPDGRRIAFSTKRSKDVKTDIYVVNSDGTGLKQLTTDPANDSTPAWSPDGRRIVFCSTRDGAEKSYVYTMAADGTALKRLTDSQGFFARFSPDGKLIAFATQGFPKNAIFLMRADGTGLKQLTP